MWCPFCFQEKGHHRVCPACGFDEPADRESRFLPYRHRLRDGRYTVGVVLGKPGGFGVAYKAWDATRNAVVVIKECLLTESGQVWRNPGDARVHVQEGFRADYRKWVQYFIDEGRLIQRFAHPCIVRVTEVFEENGTACYVMPFVEGTDLVHHCAQQGHRLPESEVVRLATLLLPALAEIHASGWVHRDIKPSNVLITANRRKPVLIDFGAARDSFDDERSRSHIAMHTRAYAPPEQMQASRRQGAWTDMYSLSATLYYCLLGEPPPEAAVRKEASSDPYVPIHERLPGIGSRLATLIDNGLILNPARRLQDATIALRLLGNDTRPGDLQPVQSPAPGPSEAVGGGAAVSPAPALTPTSPPPPALPLKVPAREPPLPWWVGLLPGAAVVAYGWLAGEALASYLAGLPGLIVVTNGVAWAWWLQRRRRAAKDPAAPVLTPPSTQSNPAISATSTLSGTSELQADEASVVGIEIQLHPPGSPPLFRTIRPGQTLVIGRTARADLVVTHETLSGRHASIHVAEDGRYTLEDLNSLNHTYLYQRGGAGEQGTWREIQSAGGRKGRFMLGPQQDGVRLDIRQITLPP